MSIIYLNGHFLPQEKATVSIMDRGFLFGDGVYEVIPVYDRHIMGVQAHLDRLKDSLNTIHMPPPLTDTKWKTIFKTLLEKNNHTHGTQSIYLQVTRGAQTTRQHALPETCNPTVVAFLVEPKPYSLPTLNKGFSAITLEDTRARNCHIKAITLLPNILLNETARRAGAAEAILIRDGKVTEGIHSNVFIVYNQQLLTPPLSTHVIGGVTRELIIALAKQHNIPFKEHTITEAMLNKGSEIWMTGSTKEILPITQLNGQAVGRGLIGPLWKKMIDYYQGYKAAL